MLEPAVLVVALSILNALVIRQIWGQRIHWFEAACPFGVCLLICLGCKFAADSAATSDQEFHGGWCVRVDHMEPWTEEYTVEVDDYCTRTNSKGQTERYRCGSHRETRTRHHPPSWTLVDSNGYRVAIDAPTFARLCDRLGTKTRHHLQHPGQVSWGDGGMERAEWSGDERSFVPVTTRHTYTNKVQAAARSVFHFQATDPADQRDFGLFDLPTIDQFYRLNYLQGDSSPRAVQAAEALAVWNARLGHAKQVSMHILVFRNQPIEAALKQEAYWMGGNKNEFTVCVGLDATDTVAWSHVISWTDQERLKIDVRDFARTMGRWDPVRLVEFLGPAVQRDFVRKPFADFDYLQVDTPLWGKILAVVGSILAILGIDVVAIRNNLQADDRLMRAVTDV